MAEAKTASVRPHAGVDAADRLAARRARLLEAGLDLLGADRPAVAELTVRGICREAGLTVRYFYESFTDKGHRGRRPARRADSRGHRQRRANHRR